MEVELVVNGNTSLASFPETEHLHIIIRKVTITSTLDSTQWLRILVFFLFVFCFAKWHQFKKLAQVLTWKQTF